MHFFIIYRPVTPSKRHYLNIFYFLSKPVVKKQLKKLYTKTIISKNNGNLFGIVFSIEYDCFRNAFIASVFNLNSKSFFYTIAPKHLKIGNIIKTGQSATIKVGNSVSLKQIPIGCPIFNITTQYNNKGKFSKAAGSFSLILTKKFSHVILLLNSGTKKKLFNLCLCSIGVVSNELNFLKQLGKAGRSRWLGFKPKVRGVAMNPVDHKNGGGDGKKSPKNCWF